MALKDLFALVDDKLRDIYHIVAYDAAKDRARMIKRIEETKSKFLATEPPRGRKYFGVSNNVVEYRPTLPGGGALVMEKREVSYIPAERFAEFLDGLRAEVAEGNLDKELEAASKGTPSDPAKPPRSPRSPRTPSTSAGEGAGWSEERRQRFAASIAARKAAKEAAAKA